MSFSKPWRPYQKEADERICFETKNRILVKMFCGTGKSLIMRYGKSFQNHSLCVYVFPSLSLINQFDNDYLQDVANPLKLIVSSDEGHTTNEEDIQTFLQQRENKILCITYQSFELIKDVEIPMCVLDEAHHVTSETYQPLFLENTNIQRMCLFTATPKKSDTIDYGETVYEYSYLRGVAEGYLNPFEIRVDLVGENSNKIIYESIARTYFTTGNNRILTFHADVNTDSPTSVRNFVNQIEIQKAFETIQKEFPSQPIPNIHVRGFYSEMKAKERRALLETFDASQDVFLLSSCETMGEGVDTKNANMCVFVDPKSSFVKIIQNIGRIVRKQYGIHKPHSTILLPIYIDKTKYESCTTAEECDEAIRKDMASGGDFTAILNVLSALRQEDEDLYEICLHYPNEYSPQEIEENLRTQGYTIGEQVDIDEVMEHVEEEDVQVDVHTNSLETPIITHGESEHVINILQQGDEYFEIQGEEKKIQPPKERVKMTVHTNPDVKVLWKLQGELNLGSCLMDCEVIDNWNERLEELIIFLETNKRKPSATKKSEKYLAYWISNTLSNYKFKKNGFNNNPERYTHWELFIETYKEYFKSNDEKWNERLEEIKQFINKEKRRPSQHTKIEKSLNIWLSGQIFKYNKKRYMFTNLEQSKQWETFMEEYKEYFTSLDELWHKKLEEIKQFINKEKRRPSQHTKIEKPLGSWLSNQIKNYNTKTDGFKDNLERCKQWEDFVEKYKEYFKTLDEIWDDNFKELKIFVQHNKRRPSNVKKLEKLLAKWLSHQITNYKTKKEGFKNNPERCKQWGDFLEQYKEYFKTLDEIWDDNFKELKIFVQHNKRKPCDKKESEKNIYVWTMSQISNYKFKKYSFNNNPERCKQWGDFIEQYKEYFQTIDDKWEEMVEELKHFIIINQRKPNKRSDNEKEKISGNWLSQQKTNYKFKRYSFNNNPERCKQWKDFLEEYKEYLTPKKSMKLKKETTTPTESTEQKQYRVKSELSVLHQHYKTMRSDTLAQHFKDNPDAWSAYHTISESNEESFPTDSIPRNQIIRELDKIKTRRPKQVVDMGCGMGFISKHFMNDSRFKFTNIDHVAINETVQVGDISKLPFENDSQDICILSLAMWGSNCKEYIQEAHRVLETNGTLYIIEPTKRWTETEPADRLVELLKDFYIRQITIEKFTFIVAIK
jgi:superfamily II DNA or RNA helicase